MNICVAYYVNGEKLIINEQGLLRWESKNQIGGWMDIDSFLNIHRYIKHDITLVTFIEPEYE